jgi:hypothetical protein
VAYVDDGDELLPNGALVRVAIETHAYKDKPAVYLPGWGLIDGNAFRLLWTKHEEVWDECSLIDCITLNPSEIESAKDVGAPTEVEVALAKFRLTGVIERPSDFVKE